MVPGRNHGGGDRVTGFDKVVLAVAGLLLLPVLISPAGWGFGFFLVLAWIVSAYGGRYLLDLEKQRRQGERGMSYSVRKTGRER